MKARRKSRQSLSSTLKSENGFGTFGFPMVEVTDCRSRDQARAEERWIQKWFVHLMSRPEAIGGIVHFTMTGQKRTTHSSDSDPEFEGASAEFRQEWDWLHFDVVSRGLAVASVVSFRTRRRRGRLVTVFKWFFDEDFVIPNLRWYLQTMD